MYTGPNIVRNGLVLNLDAASARSYPGSGTTWTDLSGFRNNGTLTNGPTFSSANGGSVVFDGTNDYVVTTSGQTYYQYTTQLSVCCWIRRNGILGQGTGVGQATFNADNMSTNVWLMHGETSNIFTFYVNDNGTWRSVTSALINDATWYFITGTISTTNIQVYVNGVLSNSSTGISTGIRSNSNSVIGLGCDIRYPTSRLFKGNIASTQVYNRALSATEILQNYNATKARFGL